MSVGFKTYIVLLDTIQENKDNGTKGVSPKLKPRMYIWRHSRKCYYTAVGYLVHFQKEKGD